MGSVNKAILVGNLGKDPEVKYVSENNPVANFSIATTDRFKDKSGNWQDATEWHNIVAWGRLAEVAEKFLRKGKQVYVEGKLRTRTYDDKEGNKRYVTEVLADTIQMLGRKEDDGSGGGSEYNQDNQRSYQNNRSESAPQQQSAASVQVDEDDLPF